jgi:hypothetical protein
MGAAAARVTAANATEIGDGAAKARGTEIAGGAIKASLFLAIGETNVWIRLLTIQTMATAHEPRRPSDNTQPYGSFIAN